MKFLILLLCTITLAYSQDGRVFDTYYTHNDSTNESHQTIFPKPFQSFNYIKTQRGIEVYETYKIKSYSTNESKGTIFSKPFPTFIIIDNKMYATYKNKDDSTNQSHGTIFTKPFESKQIVNITNKSKSQVFIKTINEYSRKDSLPKYDGSGEITYGE